VKLWSMKVGKGALVPVALRTRRAMKEWAAQRYMGSTEYTALEDDLDAKWKIVKRNHPGIRIVRVTVSEE